MKKWMCSVCGYTVNAEEPPENCPVCGAEKSLFELVEDSSDSKADQKNDAESANAEKSPDDLKSRVYWIVKDVITKHHLHPISVHVPNGVAPASFLFLLVSFLSGGVPALEKASFINLVFVLLAMPVVVFTGYTDWKEKYSGALTTVFKTKIICAVAITGLLFISVLWRSLDAEAGSSWLYLLINAAILVCAGLAGFMGGKLVFKN